MEHNLGQKVGLKAGLFYPYLIFTLRNFEHPLMGKRTEKPNVKCPMKTELSGQRFELSHVVVLFHIRGDSRLPIPVHTTHNSGFSEGTFDTEIGGSIERARLTL